MANKSSNVKVSILDQLPSVATPLTDRATAETVPVTLHINGTDYMLNLDPRASLLDVLL